MASAPSDAPMIAPQIEPVESLSPEWFTARSTAWRQSSGDESAQ